MRVRWVTVFLDRPAERFEATRDFWLAATATALSPVRGAHGEFATLLPSTGDAHVRIQRVDAGPGGSHLDVHVDDIRIGVDEAVGLGAAELDDRGGVVVLRSPGGLVFCVVGYHGEREVAPPVTVDATRTVVDQVCLDIAPDRFDAECGFWAQLLDRPLERGREEEFAVLPRPVGQPLRFLLQRRGEADRGLDAGCHIDIACDDVGVAVRAHEALGASVVATFPWWTVLFDPSGVEYCLTSRDPDTGLPSR